MQDFLSVIKMRRLVEAWNAAKLDPKTMEPVTEGIKRYAELSADAKNLREPDTRRLGALLAAGAMTLEEAISQHAIASMANQVASVSTSSTRLRLILDAGQRAVSVEVQRRLQDQKEEIVGLLVAALASLEGMAQKVAPIIAGLTDGTEAIAAGQKAAAAWAKVAELEECRSGLVDTRRALGQCGIVSAEDLPADFWTRANWTLFRFAREEVAA